jgi:hypothetical protein
MTIKKTNHTSKKTTPSLILIKTNQTEKVKKILEQEKVSYEIYSNDNQQDKRTEFLRKLAKLSPKELKEIADTEKLINSLDRARIKYLIINNK